jgi:D-alanyl-lipoteichoic acid acyltransferase DltB (MBOAT superfamily)
MLFNSPQFIIFFAIVTTLFFNIPRRWQWLVLLLASCLFYMAFIPIYILILFWTITVDYVAGIMLEDLPHRWRKLVLLASVIANVGVLAVFKYAGFLEANLSAVAKLVDWNYSLTTLAIVLPIGLSFHTFQSLSYTIEVYKGRVSAERHPGIFALYVMFYPQLVAGPIERPQNLLHQLRATHEFDYRRVVGGLQLMAWGFFKKMVIADRIALLVNPIFSDPTAYNGLALTVAVIGFAYQIYNDFSGYSDIAVGAAEVMGIRLMRNFNRPYAARSIPEFWGRWHISLSTWFRDYVYIPLGGNRVSTAKWCVNVLITFLLSGLWHGANWTFVIWGGLHGAYYLVSAGIGQLIAKSRLQAVIHRLGRAAEVGQMIITFVLVSFAWIFFRSASLSDALFIVTHLFTGTGAGLIQAGRSQVAVLLLLIVILEIIQWLQSRYHLSEELSKKPGWFRWSVYYVGVMAILLLGVFSQQEFIYFQF